MRPVDPELAPRAEAELEALGFPVASWLFNWLQELAIGSVPASRVRLLLGAPHDPPWQWTPYIDGIVVIFRFLSTAELEEEERASQGPQILVARITSESALSKAAAELLRNAP